MIPGRRSIAPAAVLLAVLLAGCPERPGNRPRPPRTLWILTLNDFHGQLNPNRIRSYETPRRTVRVGGAEALVATVAEIRRTHPGHVLLLDAGDFMQGSVLSNSFEGAPVRALYQRLGVAATVIGNHEFDFGPVGPRSTGGADPRGALKAWLRAAPFPVLSANLADAAGRPVSWPNLRPVLLLERGGIRVGLIGLTTLETPATTHPANLRGLTFRPLAPVVTHWARVLRQRGAEVVVILGHLGSKCRGRSAATCHGEMVQLLKALPRGTVDAAVAGHSHQCMWHVVNGVPVVQACARGVALGRLRITVGDRGVKARALPPRLVCHDVFSDGGGCEAKLRVGKARGRVVPSPLLARHAGVVGAMRRRLQGYRQRLRPRPDTVLAHVARTLYHTRRGGVSPMGQLIAEVLRRAVPGARVALVNSGGVRAGLAQGPVTYRDVYRVFPFDNQLAYADLTGRQLRRLVASYLAREHSGFLLVSGLRYRVRCGGAVRLTHLTDAQGRPLDPKRIYRVALSDFLLAGGDGFGKVLRKVPAARKRVLRGQLVRDAIFAYLRAQTRPLNTAAHPVIDPTRPPITVDNPPCGRPRPRKHSPRHICR